MASVSGKQNISLAILIRCLVHFRPYQEIVMGIRTMLRPIYVIGHKNSDLDAVASAYAYARLLRMQGEEQVTAARNGPLQPEVRFALERARVDPPEAVDDLYLHVRDVMRRDVICAYLDEPLLETGRLLQEHHRDAMPVVDIENKVHGIIAIEDFIQPYLNGLNPHTLNTAQLLNVSASTKEIMKHKFDICRPEDRVREVQSKLGCSSLPVVDGEGRLVGDLSCIDILNPCPKRVILVDLNEQSQAVDGIEEAEVLEIIDHHCTTDISRGKSTIFRAEPVGCTATIIAGLYHEAGIAIPGKVAVLLLAALLYETRILHSLNCTIRDERVAAELAGIAGEQIEKFGQELFAMADVNSRPAEAILTADLKAFTVNNRKFATGTVETASPGALEKRSEELLATMQRLAQERNYTSFLFMIVDIINIRSTLLVYGGERAVATALGLPLEKDGHTVFVERLVSRKKQLVPLLPRIEAALQSNIGAL
jgi:inorganic pyrophosphatase/exopolyphosphatase